MRAAIVAVVGLVACGAPAKPTQAPVPVPADWWTGDFVQAGTTDHHLHWVSSAGVRFGVAMSPEGFEVIVVDGAKLTAMPGGQQRLEFDQTGEAAFAGGGNTLAYAKHGDGVEAHVSVGGHDAVVDFTRVADPRAPELETADLAFAADVDKRGIDGWVAAFEPTGAQMTRKGRVEGAAAIRALMTGPLAAVKIAWAPTTSRVHGDWGFTVGLATFTGTETSKSTYVTIWHRQPDGSWKVAFDTGADAHK